MFSKKLRNRDLNAVSGGKGNLEDYLKKLVVKDKDKMLVDYGTGVELDHDSSVSYDESGNLLIVKSEKEVPK